MSGAIVNAILVATAACLVVERWRASEDSYRSSGLGVYGKIVSVHIFSVLLGQY